ncbi:serine/threonine-protein kinase [Parafrankia discariae]|uniref:serine/threonine-protein kinase n=1 Tax=Parafrankia discariae TaxID=365528 RepID=UPI0003A690A5|nr:serine/threonine-protein kinase [Parafrankia discariae]
MNTTPPGAPGGSVPAWDAVFTPLTPQDPRQISGYLLRARIGEGGMGAVYLSYTPGGRPVALKIARPEFAADPEFRRRFATEVTIAQRVQGLYTAPVIDCDPNAPRPWLATAYVAAPSLAAAVARQGPLPLETVLVLIAGVAEALQSIHAAGVIHRDLKPGNVILAADGPRVIDFGISRAVEASSGAITQTGARVGTPAFMAPEQVQGKTLAAPGDVFALGSTAYYAVTGELPFGGDAAVFHRIEHRPPDWDRCPEQVRAVLEPCVEKDPAARPTPAALIELCREASTDERLRIGEGWLPPTVVADLTRYSITPPGPPAPAPPPQNQGTTWPPAPPAPSTPGPWSAPPLPGHPGRGGAGRGHVPWLLGGLAAAAIVVVAALLLNQGDQPADRLAGTGSTQNPPTGTNDPVVDQTTTESTADITPSGRSRSSTSPSASSADNPVVPDSSTAPGVLAQEQLRMTDAADSVDVEQRPLTVDPGGGYGAFYMYDAQVKSYQRLALWSGPGEPTAANCEFLLRTQPMSQLDNHAGLRFCVAGSGSHIASGNVLSYDNGVSQVRVTVWNVKFGD